jgi:hypothetical protein
MQLYSMLFGDLEIAKGTNLLGGDYTDVYLLLIKELPEPLEYNT